MPIDPVLNRRIALTCMAFGVQAGQLGWDDLHGGVPAHHLLANPDLPAVSNWWGLLLIPLLTWWTVGQVQRRRQHARMAPRFPPVAAFVCALVYGGLLAALFASGSALVDFVFFGLLAVALVVRLWHAEYLLGFVFGMMFVTGPVLPAMFGALIALFSWLVQSAARAVWRKLRSRRGLA